MHEDARAEAAVLSKAEAYRLVEEARQMREERDALQDERNRYYAILCWYADENSYNAHGAPCTYGLIGGLRLDRGQRARDALQPGESPTYSPGGDPP